MMGNHVNSTKFEDSMKRLEEISRLLDNENIDLDEAILLYEEGIELSKICFIKLKEAELKVTTLKKSLEYGNTSVHTKLEFEKDIDDKDRAV